MPPFRDPPLGVHTPGIRKVGRRVYLADTQFMYNTALAGVRLYDIPDEAVQTLDRQTGRVELGVLCLGTALVGGIAFLAWSVWWLVPAAVAGALAPLLIGRDVSERYPAVTDPAIVKAVRRRVAVDQPPLGAVLALLLLGAPSVIVGLSHGKGLVFGLAATALVVDLIRLLVGARDRKALQEEDGLV